MSTLLYYLPLGYTYRSRLHTYRGIVAFALSEVVPLTLCLTLIYHVPLWLVSLMFLGYLSFYECGYFWNDIADSATEPGGDRLSERSLSLRVFVFIRVVLLGLVSVAVCYTRGLGSMFSFDLTSVCLVLLLIIHTSCSVRNIPFLRLTSFAALAFYRYLPELLPLLPWETAISLLTAVFLSWGLSRVLVYALRKYGDAEARASCESSQPLLRAVLSVVFAPLFLTMANVRNWRESGPLVAWASLVMGQMVWTVLHSLRRLLAPSVVLSRKPTVS